MARETAASRSSSTFRDGAMIVSCDLPVRQRLQILGGGWVTSQFSRASNTPFTLGPPKIGKRCGVHGVFCHQNRGVGHFRSFPIASFQTGVSKGYLALFNVLGGDMTNFLILDLWEAGLWVCFGWAEWQ